MSRYRMSNRKTAAYGTAEVTIEIDADMAEAAAEWLVEQLQIAQNDVGTLFSDEAYEIFGIDQVRIY